MDISLMLKFKMAYPDKDGNASQIFMQGGKEEL
jgi:hypothetical protein